MVFNLSNTNLKSLMGEVTTPNVDKSILYTIISLTVIIAILLLFFTWVGTTLSLNTSNCKKYKKQFDSLSKSYKYESMWVQCSSDEKNSLYCNNNSSTLRNFYIKTAYNCCNSDGYKNNWVHLCALQNALKLGARCLDFEVYSLKHQPIIASSSNANFSFKETFNFLTLEDVLDEIIQPSQPNTFSDKESREREPLLLHFRIKSEHTDMFNNMGQIINEKLGWKGLLSRKKGTSVSNSEISIDRLPIHELTGKVIIMIDTPYPGLVKISDLHNVTNLYSGDDYKVYRRSQIDGENELLKSASKNKIHIVLPDLNNKLSNYDISEPFKNGCQIMAMKFQQNDLNLRSYLDIFKNSSNRGLNSIENASFILKHSTLRSDENPPESPTPEAAPLLGLGGTADLQTNIKLKVIVSKDSFSFPRPAIAGRKYPLVKITIANYTGTYTLETAPDAANNVQNINLSSAASSIFNITFKIPDIPRDSNNLKVKLVNDGHQNIKEAQQESENCDRRPGSPEGTVYNIETVKGITHATIMIKIIKCI